jgi:hypothetical protein
MGSYTDGANPWSAATMRNAERLVQIEVADVGAEVTRFCNSNQRIEICAVNVHLAAVGVHHITNVANVRLEHAMSGGIGDHECRQAITGLLAF